MAADIERLKLAQERLAKFVGPAPYTGKSGYDVYPGGIFCKDGPNDFYDDIRSAISSIEALQAEIERSKSIRSDLAKEAQQLYERAQTAEVQRDAWKDAVEGERLLHQSTEQQLQEQVERLQSQRDALKARVDALEAGLLDADWYDQVEDFLDDYSDAEIIDGRTHPNKAMSLLCQLRERR